MPSDDGFMYKNIDSENLLKGFEGLLRIRPDPDNSQCWNFEKLTCNIDWNRVFGEDGPIVWRTSYIGSMAKPSFQNFCPLMTFIYNIPDLLELKQLCVAADTQNKCQVMFFQIHNLPRLLLVHALFRAQSFTLLLWQVTVSPSRLKQSFFI